MPMNSSTFRSLFLAAAAAASLAASAPVFALALPQNAYNAIRCRRPSDLSVAAHLAIFRGQPLGLYWIENDHVRVLANDLAKTGSVVRGRKIGTNEFYSLDTSKGELTLEKDGQIVMKEGPLACVECPVELDYCPGDEPGHGTSQRPQPRYEDLEPILGPRQP